MISVPYCEIAESQLTDKVLVQGVIDLFCLGEKNIILDYKLSSFYDDKKLIEKYKKQIFLYKKAIMLGHHITDIECYILDINRARLIKINV